MYVMTILIVVILCIFPLRVFHPSLTLFYFIAPARRSLTDLMYGKQTEWETWGSGHLRSREEEVDALKDLLPAGCELSKDHVKTIKGKLPARLDKVYPRWYCFVRVRCCHLNRARTAARAHCAFAVSTKFCVEFLLFPLRS